MHHGQRSREEAKKARMKIEGKMINFTDVGCIIGLSGMDAPGLLYSDNLVEVWTTHYIAHFLSHSWTCFFWLCLAGACTCRPVLSSNDGWMPLMINNSSASTALICRCFHWTFGPSRGDSFNNRFIKSVLRLIFCQTIVWLWVSSTLMSAGFCHKNFNNVGPLTYSTCNIIIKT